MSAEMRRADGLRVMTLNLWGPGPAWDERRAVLADGIRGLRPDVVALQEVVKGDDRDGAQDILGPTYHVVHQSVGLVGDGNHGASIASRWPIGEVREADLRVTSRTGDYPCGTLAAEILAPEPLGPFLFACHGPSHQPSYEHERELQAVSAARLVEEMAGRVGARHVIVAGDFNADPDADSVAFWRGRRSLGGTSVCYRDAWLSARPGDPGHTFTPRNPRVAENKPALDVGRRIDYVFVRSDDATWGATLGALTCALAFEEPVGGVWASDHSGVVADFAVRPGRR